MFSILFLVLLSVTYQQDPATDLVDEWPLYPAHDFKTYSGFIDTANNQIFHYIFFESTSDPQNKPVIIWFGGGPGCSCMLGLIREIGPYVIEKFGNTFEANPYSLHHLANILYLDVPAGVGYSQINDPDYVFSDDNTARDAYAAIKKWHAAYLEYQDFDFWIGGESYSGMYVPFTAKAIIIGEQNRPDNEAKINIKGILVGNGVLVNNEDFFEKWNRQFMIKKNFYDSVTSKVLINQCSIKADSPSCKTAKKNEAKSNEQINLYGVYDYCFGDSTIEQKFKDDSEGGCLDVGPLNNFFNNKDIKQKLKIPQEYVYLACNFDIFYNYHGDPIGSHVLMPFLQQNGVRILQYSGNTDDVVSTDYTFESLKQIEGIKIQKKWTPFKNRERNDLGGWIVEYNYLTLYVIRGAGHLVPLDQRSTAFQMFQDFINNK